LMRIGRRRGVEFVLVDGDPHANQFSSPSPYEAAVAVSASRPSARAGVPISLM
jgi:hypothetical protein